MDAKIEEDMIPDIQFVIFRKCTPMWEMPKQKTGAFNLTYVVQGEARYVINGEPVELTQGSLLVLPENYVRSGITFPDRLMHCFSVDFHLRKINNRDVALPFPICSRPGRHEDILHMFHDLSFSWLNKHSGYIIKCRGLFLQIIHRFLELVVFKDDSNSGDSRVTKVIRYMAAHYSERITVKMMAGMVGLNPTYFGLLFKQVMKTSFNQYLIQLRVRNAELMLAGGEYKVSDIAGVCGFTDMSHFYKQYKMIRGFPPSHSMPKKF
jgi:AraC-like DNA-binding protein